MRLSEIWIYPVKSLGGIRLKESQVEERGLRYDRRWMVVDENGKFLTQRVNAKMALIDVSLDVQGLILSYRFKPENQILVPFLPISSQQIKVKVWKDNVEARTVSDEADAWLSEQLEKKVRIVEMPEFSQRAMDPASSIHGRSVSFADDFPYLLISEGSLNDLNSKLSEPVEMKRFRPNFVVSGPDAFAEDSWKYIRIGDLDFEVAKPCERCLLINIDPKTATKETEPLKTLATYRKVNKNIFFGQNVVSMQNGIVKEGDLIKVLES